MFSKTSRAPTRAIRRRRWQQWSPSGAGKLAAAALVWPATLGCWSGCTEPLVAGLTPDAAGSVDVAAAPDGAPPHDVTPGLDVLPADSGAICSSAADCDAAGSRCVEGQCVACDSDADCASGSYCAQHSCHVAACTANSSKCTDSHTRATCDARGRGWKSHLCEVGQLCLMEGDAALCKDSLCAPGVVQCVGQRVMKCDVDGGGRRELADCSQPDAAGKARVCAGGKCVTCQPGSVYCAPAPPGGPSTVLMKCSETGTEGDIAEVCTSPAVCIKGACSETAVCTPGTLYCGPPGSDGKSTLVLACNDQGNDGDIHAQCTGETSCKSGKCVGKSICTPGQTVCHGLNMRATCSGDGTEWSIAPCASGSGCSAGSCTPGLICAAKQVYCEGTVLKLCNDKGTASLTGMDCLSLSETCLDGLCVTDACAGKPGPPACGDGCCSVQETANSCPADCPCSGGVKLLSAAHWCDDGGSKPGFGQQPGLCMNGTQAGWFNGLPCPFDVAVGHEQSWQGPCMGCLGDKIIKSGADHAVAAWRNDPTHYYCCAGKDLRRVAR